MSDSLRVILEVGKKRRVVAGAMDWPGLDRWGTSEDDAIEKLLAYAPRYAGVAERAGLAKAFAKAGDVEVVERVPGSSSTDFWGIAHVPSQIEIDILPAADLERRLDLLRACWATFDDVSAAHHRPARARTAERRADPRADHPPRLHQRARAVLAQGRDPDAAGRRHDPGRPQGPPAGLPRRDPRLQRRGPAGPHLADPVPRPANRPPRDGSRVGAGGPRPRATGPAREPS